MGTSSSNKKKSIKNNELSLYEKIPIVTGDFDIIIYKLIWQKRPKILGFEIITSELITKDTNLNFDLIFDNTSNSILKKYKSQFHFSNTFLYYIQTQESLIITKKISKIKFLIPLTINKLIRFSIVDFSNIKKQDPIFFSLYALKTKSKYYFDLRNCKIDLSERTKKIYESNNINYSDNEINLDDKEQGENEERENELVIYTNINENVNYQTSEFLYKGNYEKPFKRYLKINKKTNQFEENLYKKDTLNFEDNNEKLIIDKNTNKFSILSKSYNINQPEYNLFSTFLRRGIPFDKREQKTIIEKIVVKFNDFNQGTFYFKEFINVIIEYNNLKKFAFYNNNILNEGFKVWNYLAKLFLENFNIRWINFNDAKLTNKALKILIDSLFRKRIRYLNLGNNLLSDSSMRELGYFLEENKTLSRLYLNNNKYITTEGLKLLKNGLKNHPNLSSLNLSYCNLNNSGECFKIIISNLNLRNLSIRNVNLNLNDFKIFSEIFSSENCNIIFLDISFNVLKDASQNVEIGNLIKNNKTLKKLNLDGMNLNMINYMPIFKAIYQNQTIESYSFNQNGNLPMQGFLNFFLEIKHVKEISFIPWNVQKEKNKNFSQEEIQWIKIFHSKNPNIKINGVNF